MENYLVYMHKCLINNKVYIGITNNPERRWRYKGIEYKPHKKENQNGRSFWNAIQKHGWDNFEHIILQENLSFEEAIDLEIEYIKKYDSNNKDCGYNISKGGNGGKIYEEHPRGMLGKKQSEHQIENHKKWASDNDNNCMKNGKVVWGLTHEHPKGMKDKKHTEETRKRISENSSGGKNHNSKKCISTLNGETREFDSARECMAHFNISPDIFYKIIKKGEPFAISKNNRWKEKNHHLIGLLVKYK